ncbi:LysR family transcriptional regulator [Pandoraea pulmonicola]|uniref:D-malate degradation protein R n=1 Tax=Pandoraea pulmonicola TaxID=93221 RepID=A0AAJ4Z8J2_PANPU|nr:LysR family transcriptional regulator [Pandoraea pulmonicola]AJC22205.1 LysR family transcriptional regulator [Pandoraea pulmonicola]SUA88750.1 D-malate degradation protein R [Pandoraea pulmonicola]
MATDKLGDMRLFTSAATLGSLSAAGRKLGLSPAAASARLAKLEASLQTRLFVRTTRALRLTDEGRVYLAHCLVALQAIDDGEAALQAGCAAIRGKIRLSASTDFGLHTLSPWLDEFTARYPDVRLSLTLTDSLTNLVQDDVDLAIRFSEPDDGTLVARRLAPMCRVLCASPDYLAQHGEPHTPDALSAHRFIVLVTSSGPLNEFHFRQGEATWAFTVPMAQAWETNDGTLARRWALDGRGIVRKTLWDAADDVRAGRLKIVLSDYIAKEPGVYAVRHRTSYMVPRVRALLDFLIERFARESAAWPDIGTCRV